MRFLFILFILFPILEMVVLIKVGSVIGAWNTVGLVVLSAVVGVEVVRREGFRNALKAREKMAAGELPAQEMVENLAIVLGGVLMIIPGFISDFMGIVLLIPPLRRLLVGRWLKLGGVQIRRASVYDAEYRREDDLRSGQRQNHRVLDGEYTKDSGDQSDRT